MCLLPSRSVNMRCQNQWQWRWSPLLVLLALCSTLSTALECYSRNGVNANSSEFYNATADGQLIGCGNTPTTCCMEGQYCDVDLLCHDRKTGDLSRQYCSDPEWPEGSCSAVCPDYAAAGITLTPCDDSGTKFCCGPSSSCCEDGSYTQINKLTGKVVAIGTSTIPSSSTATATATGSSSTGVGASATSTSTGGGGGGGGGLSEQSKLGIGLGVGLGVPFFIAIGAALFLWKRALGQKAGQVNEAKAPVPGSSPGSESGPAPGYVQDAGVAATPRELGTGVDNKPVHQLEANPARAELGDDRVYELGS